MDGASKILLKEYNNGLIIILLILYDDKELFQNVADEVTIERKVEIDRVKVLHNDYDECLSLMSLL